MPAPADDRRARSLEILFRPDPTLGDGRWANNGWLQELPKPLDQTVVGQRRACWHPPWQAGWASRTKTSSSSVIAASPYSCRPGSCRARPRNRSRCSWATGAGEPARSARASASTSMACEPPIEPWSGSGLEVTKTSDTAPAGGHASLISAWKAAT